MGISLDPRIGFAQIAAAEIANDIVNAIADRLHAVAVAAKGYLEGMPRRLETVI